MATEKGVRKIPVSATSLTGSVLGAEFESSLERDLILKMAFHRYIDYFQSQPLTIDYTDKDGKARTYTPDLFVMFSDVSPVASKFKPMLCEVKYSEDLIANWQEYKPKFQAATQYARRKGWTFKIFNESRIRDDELSNIQFLWRYRHSEYDYSIADRLIECMVAARREVTMHESVREAYSTDEGRGLAIFAWWVLVARRVILFDFTQKIAPNTTFWLREEMYR